MSVDTTQIIAPRPSALAWFLALASALLAFCAAVLVLGIGGIVYSELRFEALIHDIESRSFAQANRDLSEVLKPPRIFRLVSLEPTLRSEAELMTRGSFSRSLLTLISAIDANQFEVAQSQLAATESLIERTESFAAESDRLRRLLALHTQFLAAEAAVAESRKERDGVLDASDLLASDFGELFGLAPVDPSDENSLAPVYQQGILERLPVLVGLPDNIDSLETLQQELHRLHASVHLDSGDQHLNFQQRLENIRAGHAALRAKLEHIEAQIAQSEHERLIIAGSMNQTRHAVIAGFTRYLAQVAMPKIRPWNSPSNMRLMH